MILNSFYSPAMKLFFAKALDPSDLRAPILPKHIKSLQSLGFSIAIEKGLGEGIDLVDDAYQSSGAEILERTEGFDWGEALLSLSPPTPEESTSLGKDKVWVSPMKPHSEADLLQSFASQGVTSLALDMIPRSTIAQKMDFLSSQASLAGYAAVTRASELSKKVFPMMTTPAGTIQPARLLVIGVEVAGLQAIATAKRLGARVEAYDPRPGVEEQILSLGARPLKLNIGPTEQTADGYAKALTPEQLEKQRLALEAQCTQMDVIITTAQVFGKKAPVLLKRACLDRCKPGTVIVDCAVETGGNVEGVVVDTVTQVGEATVVGDRHLSSSVALDASSMAGANFVNLLQHLWDEEKKSLLRGDDEILHGILMTQRGAIVHPSFTETTQGDVA